MFNLYLIGVAVAVPYFNWRYACDHGFVSWLLLGGIAATAKAFVWPVYVFASNRQPNWSEYELDNIGHFDRMSDAMQQAARIVNAGPPDNKPSFIPTADAQKIVSLYALALKESRLVDTNVLAKAHPELPSNFEEKLVPFLETMARVYGGQATFVEQMAAHKLHDQWVDWFNLNRNAIRIPKNKS